LLDWQAQPTNYYVIASRQAGRRKLAEGAKQSCQYSHMGKIASKCKPKGVTHGLMSRNDVKRG